MEGKVERRKALGPDYKTALKKLPGALADIQHEIALAERRAAAAGERSVTVGRYPLAADQIALRNYQTRLAQDEALRNSGSQWASVSIDDLLVARLRQGIAGQLSDDDLAELVEHRIERFRQIGNTMAAFGSDEWRSLARYICVSEYEALARVAERDEGDFSGAPSHPMLANAQPEADPLPPVSLKDLFADYIAAKKLVGKARGTEKRWRPVFTDLAKFVRHDDARRLTKKNLTDWRDELLKSLSPKTVADVYLAAVRSVLTWAVANDRLDSNAVEKVRQEVPKGARNREKGFTGMEAAAILVAARDHVPAVTDNAATMELRQTTAAKRWVPALCAFSGARVTEITQLRKEDFREEGGAHVMRISPDAGTVKAGGYRDVPLHSQLIEMGFLNFLQAAPAGPLFYRNGKGRDPIKAARATAGRISEWLQETGLIPEGVQPNHGWRHRFKTVGEEEGISKRAIDAIQGHASTTAGDNYGDVTLKARKAAIDRFPSYDLSANPQAQ
ncbi:hypothetical protein LB557_18920 [Mesorhizobium sp. BR115XR7A]|uniref:hypothetical protein n=1 Tax=Mesorhizobium sp. BR115XR7A TaxID=2876645 RepID=UPI001CC95F56|nr:hypothetical protein [Mesorhizobium sp. BR115XR7A]MBZ9908087.1 hypothetical protein [Mesorhizobium sp. BR115XR7A]MBZ9930979.1 hypothetical protein [Mesorhizobium sp. BR1-1-5]